MFLSISLINQQTNCEAEHIRTVQPVKAGIIKLVLGGAKSCVLQRIDSDLSEADLLISCALCYMMHAATSASEYKYPLCVGEGLLEQGS